MQTRHTAPVTGRRALAAAKPSVERSVSGSPDRSGRLPDGTAERVADTMFALSTPSRLQILACLRSGPRTVTQIVDAVGMEQSAVSHQLRVLRAHSVVSHQRIGRTRQYALRNEHVGALIDEALAHVDELEHPARVEAPEPWVSGGQSTAS